MGACLLMRTSSQVFLPIPVLVALQAGTGRAARLLWVLLYGFAILPPLLPWMLHNHEVHGVFRLTASTGRNLYFSGLWSNSVDRRQRLLELGLEGETPSHPFVPALRSHLARAAGNQGLSFPEADAVMGDMALRAYAERDLATLVRQRGVLTWELFFADPELNWWRRMSLRDRAREKAFRPRYETYIRETAERVYRYRFSPRAIREMEQSSQSTEAADAAFRAWILLLTFDGVPLLAASTCSPRRCCWGWERAAGSPSGASRRRLSHSSRRTSWWAPRSTATRRVSTRSCSPRSCWARRSLCAVSVGVAAPPDSRIALLYGELPASGVMNRAGAPSHSEAPSSRQGGSSSLYPVRRYLAT